MTATERKPRVGILGLWHETNTYSSSPATTAEFAEFELLSGDAIVAHHAGTGTVIGGFLDSDALELVPVFSAGAWPSGPPDRGTMADLLRRAGDALLEAGRLDGVLYNLHGAMVAEGLPDPDAALVELVRRTIGPLPGVAVLDLHANPSAELAAACEVIITYDTYPHVDMRERGREAGELMVELLAGRALRTTLGKLPMLICPLAQATDAEPMRSLQRSAAQLAHNAGLRRISIAAGFAYSDVERAGVSVLAVHDADREDDARAAVRTVLDEIATAAPQFELERPDPASAVKQALASTAPPVVLADVADNIGGGGPGDGTVLLAELVRQGARGAIVIITDPEVAREAARLGVGAPIEATVGGKTDHFHGVPQPLRGQVVSIGDGSYRTSGTWMTGQTFTMGTTAVIDVDGVTLVVTERRTPPFHVEQLTSLGIDPTAARVIVAKGAVAWRAAYGELAGEVIEVATPGICPVDVDSLPRLTTPQELMP